MGLEISTVVTERDLELFLRVPALLRPENHVNKIPGRWVRPLLDRRKNPYFRHADHTLMLARRDGRLVGRVAVFVDHLCNRTLGEQLGSFGLFDCVESPRVASMILHAAEVWLAEHDVHDIRGPCGPAMRLGTGLLVEGHGQAPMTGMTFDPPELGALVESAGFDPDRDLRAYKLTTEALPSEIVQAADEARRRDGLVLRALRQDRLNADIRFIREVLNDLPALGRACAPWTFDEVRWMAKRLWFILDPFLVLLIEQEGEPAAVGLALRNLREVFDGRSPRGSLVDSLHRATALRFRRLRSARIMLLAVRPQYLGGRSSRDGDVPLRMKGDLSALLLAEMLGRLRLLGVEWAEVSLVDPTDEPLVDLLERAHGETYKTYRIYRKKISRPPRMRASVV